MNIFRSFSILSTGVLSAFFLASCSPNAVTSTNLTETSASSSTSATTNEVANGVANVSNEVANNATNGATPATSSTPANTKTAAKPDDKNAPDKRYRVAANQEGLPPEVEAALKKARVSPPPAATKVPNIARVRLETSRGNIEVQLNGKAAPLHVKSFLHLSGLGFYDGTRFHRYIPGFVIQGGDPLSKYPAFGAPYASLTGSPSGLHGSGGPGYEVPREFNSLTHSEMMIAAARGGDPDSAGSQFYFTLEDRYDLDKEQAQDGVGYTVFGKVLKGRDVVMKLRADDVLKKVVILSPKS